VRLELPALDGRIELRGLLGQGGMGEVHRAWDASLERAVAVKFVRGSDPRDPERLLLEARLQARLEHPHVVKVHEVGTLGGRPCIVLQLVEGRSLSAIAPSLSDGERIELVRQAALGLHAAHLQGLVHRDVKPGNVLVEEGEGGARKALVTDFGLARGEEGGLTRSGIPAGTLDFMSPEQLLGEGPVDFRADVWALGATLYATVSGAPPFRRSGGDGAADPARMLRRILEEEPPPLRRVAPSAPREIALVAAKAMEKDPAARYASAEAFAEDLARFQRGEPVRARRASAGERLAKWARRNRATARASAVAFLALVLTGGWTLWRSREAGFEALEAARLGAVAASLEARMRMEHLAPPHDLRPALARVRAEVAGLGAPAARSGPASFALGKGLELLGDLDGARAAYERAWELGLHSPSVAEGLGLVLGRIYQREVERIGERFAPEGRAQRVEALNASLREPARRRLASGDHRGARGRLLLAQLRLLEGDFAAARALAGEVRAGDPGLYEALVLQGEVSIREAKRHFEEWKPEEVEASLRRALVPLQEALAWARSDPQPLELLAQAHALLASALDRRGASPAAEVEAALAWAERAVGLNPESAVALLAQGGALEAKARDARHRGAHAEAFALLEQAGPFYARAAAADPGRIEPRARLAYNLYARSFTALRQTGKPAHETLREGLRVVTEAAGAAPGDAEVSYLLMLLRNEEGAALRAEGRDATEPLRAGVAAAEALLRIEGVNAAPIRTALALTLSRLGREDWFAGRDPRPTLARATALVEEVYRSRPGAIVAANNAVGVLGDASEVLRAMGEDVRPIVGRAFEVASENVRAHPDLVFVRTYLGEVLQAEAHRRVAAGEDPTAAVEEAEPLLAPGKDGKPPDPAAWSWLPLHRASWEAAQGRDPGASIARARSRFERTLREDPDDADALFGLASCALEQALWSRRRGGSGAEAARRGLAHAERYVRAEPWNPEGLVLRARLLAQAGDLAAARESLGRALSTQPLLRGGREYRDAEAELAANAR
jgi:serine/threonine-protein kinase